MKTRTKGSPRDIAPNRETAAQRRERQLLERLFEVTCPSCDEQDIAKAAKDVRAQL